MASLILSLALGAWRSHAAIVKGVSYSPVPCRGPCAASQDDFAGPSYQPLWGSIGRSDLEVMKKLGVNRVRLFGNRPSEQHRSFLNEAQVLGIGVSMGLSDHPFIISPESCLTTGFNCFQQAKEAFLQSLKTGELQDNDTGGYHPAIQQVVVMNLADLKLPGLHDPRSFARGLISAIDGILEAELEANVTGRLVNFTAPFSFFECPRCFSNQAYRSLGQMAELREACQRPNSVGYKPRHDLAEVYRSRFTNSFHAKAVTASEIKAFLANYKTVFPETPVELQDYHPMSLDLVYADVTELLEVAEEGQSSFLGLSFSEFQTRPDVLPPKSPDFGLFDLGGHVVTSFERRAQRIEARCLVPRSPSTDLLHAFQGDQEGLDVANLCVPDAKKVTLSKEGFEEVLRAQPHVSEAAALVARIVETLGGEVKDIAGHNNFSASLLQPGAAAYEMLRAEFAAGPSWISRDTTVQCVADRRSNAHAVGIEMARACHEMQTFDCDEIPAVCRGSIWDAADYAFSAFYSERKVPLLENCYFSGHAVLASEARRNASGSKSACVVPLDFIAIRALRMKALRTQEDDESEAALQGILLGGFAAVILVCVVVKRKLRSGDRRLAASSPEPSDCVAVQVECENQPSYTIHPESG